MYELGFVFYVAFRDPFYPGFFQKQYLIKEFFKQILLTGNLKQGILPTDQFSTFVTIQVLFLSRSLRLQGWERCGDAPHPAKGLCKPLRIPC